MHGRPRPPKGSAPDEEKIKAQAQKALLFGKLLREVLDRRNAKRMDEESMGLCAKLLELNPEVYTAWNYRREFVEPILAQGGETALKWVETELQLTFKALQRNPKSYHTWHHRKWLVAKRLCSIDKELELVSLLLNADERNFHAWTYRRFLSALQGLTPDAEMTYAKLKIDQNFSNYSAWHYRTSLLPRIYDPNSEDPSSSLSTLLSQLAHIPKAECEGKEEGRSSETSSTGRAPFTESAHSQPSSVPSSANIPFEILDEEFDLVRQAFFTEPNDQSGWFYHRWLLGAVTAKLEKASDEDTRVRAASILEREAGVCAEIIEMEPNCKWALLAKAQVLAAWDSMESAPQRKKEIVDLYTQLKTADPDRAGFYTDMLQRST